MAHGNFVDGTWTAGPGRTFPSHNPADTSDVLGEFPASGPADVEAAVTAVGSGYRTWAEASPELRAAVLHRAAAYLEDRADDLARELVREEGKTLAEARNEVRRTPQNLRFYAGEAHRMTGETFPAGDGELVFTSREPVGVVAAITPWNFPLNIPSRKLGPALAAGNGVVFKPSEVTPLMGQRLVEALLHGGVPGSALALVHGGGDVGAALATDPRVSAITFTGSTAVGESIYHAAGPARRCQLEMGGKNPVVVADDADLDRAVSLITRGAFGLSGQACTGTSRVIAVEAVHDEVLERVASAASRLTVGAGLREGVDMGPLASEAQLERTTRYLELGRAEGARLVTGGGRLRGDGHERGYFVRPAVFAGLEPSMRLAREEIFGPVLGFQRAGSLDEALRLADATDYGMSACIVTRDIGRALDFARRVRSGVVKVNQATTGMALGAPFGGIKRSSTQTFKEQAGKTMSHFYTVDKTVYVSP